MSDAAILLRGQHALHLSQGELGVLMGASHRTGQRWATGRSTPSPGQWKTLAQKVYAIDPELAASAAEAGGTTLHALGLETSAERARADRIVDSVVCAAADAMDVTPQRVRLALFAAAVRARELGLDLLTIENALRTPG